MQAYTYITSKLKEIEQTDPLFSGCMNQFMDIVGEIIPDMFEQIMEELDYWLEKNSKPKKKRGRPKKVKDEG